MSMLFILITSLLDHYGVDQGLVTILPHPLDRTFAFERVND